MSSCSKEGEWQWIDVSEDCLCARQTIVPDIGISIAHLFICLWVGVAYDFTGSPQAAFPSKSLSAGTFSNGFNMEVL